MANKYTKRCLASLIIKEMQTKTTNEIPFVRKAIIKNGRNNKCW